MAGRSRTAEIIPPIPFRINIKNQIRPRAEQKLRVPLCRRPADALDGRGIDPKLNGDLAHAGAQRSPYGVFLGLTASRATDAACLDRLEALCERGLLRVLHEVVPLMLKSDLVRLVFEQNPHLLLSDVERGVASNAATR
jgi:hypothetical protein